MDWYEARVTLDRFEWEAKRRHIAGGLSDSQLKMVLEKIEAMRGVFCPEPPPLTAEFF